MKLLGRWAVAVCAGGMLIGTLPVRADEILDQVQEAIELYKQGDYSGAVSGLDFAATQIRQLQAGRVSDALPQALQGWEADEAEMGAMSGAMFGGGVTAERSYSKGDASVDVQIVGESPMLQSVLMMFNNTMIMSASGRKLTRLKGQKAAVEYDAGARSGEIQIVVMNSILVTVQGSDVAEEDLRAYAEAVDFALLKKLAAGE